jgi:hypothetical protein
MRFFFNLVRVLSGGIRMKECRYCGSRGVHLSSCPEAIAQSDREDARQSWQYGFRDGISGLSSDADSDTSYQLGWCRGEERFIDKLIQVIDI